METEWSFKYKKKLKKILEKSAFLKIPAQALEAGNFLNIFLRFLGFGG